MSDADKHRAEADELADGDLVAILLRQHADITDALDKVTVATGDELQAAFDALATFLKAHETAEQTVVRPLTQETAGADEAAARNAEEEAADATLAGLVDLGAGDADFKAVFAEFKKNVAEHAEREEHEEFPTILSSRSEEERIQLGADFLDAFSKTS